MIICDSNVLVALVDNRDQLRRRAQKDLARNISKDFLVTEPVLSESISLLPGNIQRIRLAALLSYMNVRLAPALEETALMTDVFKWLAKYGDHEPDWADAHIAVLCQYHFDYQVWTYDSEFKSIWRRPDGSVIPLLDKSN